MFVRSALTVTPVLGVWFDATTRMRSSPPSPTGSGEADAVNASGHPLRLLLRVRGVGVPAAKSVELLSASTNPQTGVRRAERMLLRIGAGAVSKQFAVGP